MKLISDEAELFVWLLEHANGPEGGKLVRVDSLWEVLLEDILLESLREEGEVSGLDSTFWDELLDGLLSREPDGSFADEPAQLRMAMYCVIRMATARLAELGWGGTIYRSAVIMWLIVHLGIEDRFEVREEKDALMLVTTSAAGAFGVVVSVPLDANELASWPVTEWRSA